jgi:hypothetical protein
VDDNYQALKDVVKAACDEHCTIRRVKMSENERSEWVNLMSGKLVQYKPEDVKAAFEQQLQESRYFPTPHDIRGFLPDAGKAERTDGGFYPIDSDGNYIPTDRYYTDTFMKFSDDLTWMIYCTHIYRTKNPEYIAEVNARRRHYNRPQIERYGRELLWAAFEQYYIDHPGAVEWSNEAKQIIQPY